MSELNVIKKIKVVKLDKSRNIQVSTIGTQKLKLAKELIGKHWIALTC